MPRKKQPSSKGLDVFFLGNQALLPAATSGAESMMAIDETSGANTPPRAPQSALPWTKHLNSTTNPVAPVQAPASRPAEPVVSGTDPTGRFETFVVGPSNRLAYAAACSIAEQEKAEYNPLIFWGGVGAGKTHLLRAIGQAFAAAHPGARVVPVTSEQFMNEMIRAINARQMDAFRRRMRDSELLLFDSVDLLAGREGIQNELHHVLNDRTVAGRQVVMTSERTPADLSLVDRLRSRLQEGLIVQIRPPETETCAGILRTRAAAKGLVLSSELLAYLAKRLPHEARVLIGVVNRLAFLHKVGDQEITIALCEQELGPIVTRGGEDLSLPALVRRCADQFGVTAEQIMSPLRKKDIVAARQAAMHLARQTLGMSTTQVGRAFGDRDHSTVLHASACIEKRMATDADFRRTMDALAAAVLSA